MDKHDLNKLRSGGEKIAAGARKTIVKAGSALLVAISLLAGAAFDSPGDIIDNPQDIQINKAPIVMDIDEYTNVDIDDEDDADEEKSAKTGIFARFRQAVFALPTPVRVLVITPLWAIGTALMTVASLIFSSPIGSFIASLFIGFAVIVGLYVVTAKMLFPDIPVRELLSKKNLMILAAGALVLSCIDAVMPLFWQKYPALSFLVKLAFGGSLVGLVSMRAKALFQNKLLRA